jgi:hypothetical protein
MYYVLKEHIQFIKYKFRYSSKSQEHTIAAANVKCRCRGMPKPPLEPKWPKVTLSQWLRQARHSQCYGEYIYIRELELHPGISPTLMHTEKYNLCIREYNLYIWEYNLCIWEYNLCIQEYNLYIWEYNLSLLE